ncbi:hypothetical protein WJX75_008955 [Coccomyxa subellipsoidea]|uniref:Uncharacterized protein n=1 Tax=Coccomyxa subellipsoidea TaxID=248742 RepID=A0ABR2YII3_9CHLO
MLLTSLCRIHDDSFPSRIVQELLRKGSAALPENRVRCSFGFDAVAVQVTQCGAAYIRAIKSFYTFRASIPGYSAPSAFTRLATASFFVVVFAVLFSAAHLGAAHASKTAQLGRHMLQLGVNGAAFARPAGSRCLVGPTCGQGRESSPSPANASGRRHLSEDSTAGLSGATDTDATMGRHILQNGFNGAAYVRPQRDNPRDIPNSGNGRNLLQVLTGLS